MKDGSSDKAIIVCNIKGKPSYITIVLLASVEIGSCCVKRFYGACTFIKELSKNVIDNFVALFASLSWTMKGISERLPQDIVLATRN